MLSLRICGHSHERSPYIHIYAALQCSTQIVLPWSPRSFNGTTSHFLNKERHQHLSAGLQGSFKGPRAQDALFLHRPRFLLIIIRQALHHNPTCSAQQRAACGFSPAVIHDSCVFRGLYEGGGGGCFSIWLQELGGCRGRINGGLRRRADEISHIYISIIVSREKIDSSDTNTVRCLFGQISFVGWTGPSPTLRPPNVCEWVMKLHWGSPLSLSLSLSLSLPLSLSLSLSPSLSNLFSERQSCRQNLFFFFQPWTFLYFTWHYPGGRVVCVKKCVNRPNRTLNRLYSAGCSVQSLCNVQWSRCVNRRRATHQPTLGRRQTQSCDVVNMLTGCTGDSKAVFNNILYFAHGLNATMELCTSFCLQ